MKIGDYEFSGPFDSVSDLKSVPGLFVIVYVGKPGTTILMEVEYGTNIVAAIESTVTKPSWQERTKDGLLRYGVHYTCDSSEMELKQVLKNLKNQYLVTCTL